MNKSGQGISSGVSEEKWMKSISCEVFSDGTFSIYLKKRSNIHPSEPDYKVWVRSGDRELCSYCNHYRGYDLYADNEALLPEYIRALAKKVWKDLCEGKYPESKIEELKQAFMEKHKAVTKVPTGMVHASNF